MQRRITNIFRRNKFLSEPGILVTALLFINFLIRVVLYFNTNLFNFSDYSSYLNAIDRIYSGETQYLLDGNFLYAISYIGYFAKYILGDINYFFIFNCLLATLTSLILYCLVKKFSGSMKAGLIMIVIHTLYTEFMVFSSVFYTPVIMLFILSLFILVLHNYLSCIKKKEVVASLFLLVFIFLLSFFFKPELKFLPYFLLPAGLFFYRKNKAASYKTITLSCVFILFSFIFSHSGIITKSTTNVISNEFVFFGHTGYGGDGGEGSFVYPENKARYMVAFNEYCKKNKIVESGIAEYNAFNRMEVQKYITEHPFNWIGLQLTKFFRTFGVVPETTSFKVLYTGLFKGNLIITSIIVVVPVTIIIMLFIALFSFKSIRQLINGSIEKQQSQFSNITIKQPLIHDKKYFLYIYILLFLYYIIATVFYGHYQERYRMSVMVVFIIPALGYFIASFEKEEFIKKSALIIKSVIIIIFLATWIFQAKEAIGKKDRFKNAIESAELHVRK